MKKIALIGNPNCGKTTIFNSLTSENYNVGNWPGVTVEKLEGSYIYKNEEVKVVDLPGIYSLNYETIDEKIATEFILKNRNEYLFINVIDSQNFKRNLLLTIDLLEMGVPLIIVLNMYDLLKKENKDIKINVLQKIFNVPVVKTIGNKSSGINELKEAIYSFDYSRENKFMIDYGVDLEKVVEDLLPTIKSLKPEYNEKLIRWFILNSLINFNFLDLLEIPKENKEEVIERINNFNKLTGEDLQTLIISRRYGYIEGLAKEVVVHKPSLERMLSLSKSIDFVLTNRFLGIPIFIFILWLTFQLVFTVGGPLSDLLSIGVEEISKFISLLLNNLGAPKWIESLLVEGIINGVGNVIVFLPSIMILFFVITILEDSGYMARGAFMMDKVMHLFGLHGKSFIPFVLGFGCNVPAILATRTLKSTKDRILTILILPLMSCSARLPVYVLFTSIFFKKHQGLVILSLYLTGGVLAVIIARIFKRLFFPSEISYQIMEMPPYRLPHMKTVWRITWFRSKSFLKKAGTVILAASVIVWFLASFPFGVEYASADSIIGRIGKILAPIFAPAGFGDWRATVSLLFGIMAKEIVVSTMGVLYTGGPLNEVVKQYFTPISAYSFMLTTLIYVPCIAAISAIKNEAGTKWALLTVSYQLFLAWLVSTLFYQIATLLF